MQKCGLNIIIIEPLYKKSKKKIKNTSSQGKSPLGKMSGRRSIHILLVFVSVELFLGQTKVWYLLVNLMLLLVYEKQLLGYNKQGCEKLWSVLCSLGNQFFLSFALTWQKS